MEAKRTLRTWMLWDSLTDEEKDELLKKLVLTTFTYSEIAKALDIEIVV